MHVERIGHWFEHLQNTCRNLWPSVVGKVDRKYNTLLASSFTSYLARLFRSWPTADGWMETDVKDAEKIPVKFGSQPDEQNDLHTARSLLRVIRYVDARCFESASLVIKLRGQETKKRIWAGNHTSGLVGNFSTNEADRIALEQSDYSLRYNATDKWMISHTLHGISAWTFQLIEWLLCGASTQYGH
jgi:hypothetical protein